MRVMKWSMIALAVSAGTTQFAMASSQDDAKGFVEDSTLTSKTRMLYMNRDFRNGAGNIAKPGGGFKSGYREDWGLSELLNYQSGFTQGTIGVGVDAFAMGTVRLDGGAGRQGNGLFATKSDGSPEDTQSKIGGAVKFRLSDTVLKYGNQFVASPVFSTDDSRLLPEVATGTLLTSKEIKGLELSAGRFTALSSQTGMARDSINGPGQPGLTSANIAGATYQFTDNLVGGVAASDVDDYFKKQYINLNYTLPIADSQALNFDFNGYRTSSQGQELAGDVDNKIWSLAAAYSLGAHKFTIAHQRSTGDSGYYYGVDGGGTIFLANSVQYSDFNAKDEQSWQLSYAVDFAQYGLPGLTYRIAYVRGTDIDASIAGGPSTTDGKEHELFNILSYKVQSGPAKDLNVRLRASSLRVSNDAIGYNESGKEVRIFLDYPFSVF